MPRRKKSVCPHCGADAQPDFESRFLLRCSSLECGRYFTKAGV